MQNQSRPALHPLEARRGTIGRVEALAGGVFRVAYSFECAGAGETSVDINFPVAFAERPHCTSGGSLVPGSVLEDGNFPWCSAMMGAWVTETRGGQPVYVGGTVVIVLSGSSTQHAVIDLAVEGKALQAPLPKA